MIILSGCSKEVQVQQFDYFNFDTSIEIKVYSPALSNKEVQEIDADLGQLLNGIENTFSKTIPSSMLSKLNNNIDNQVSDEFITVLDLALDMCIKTNGLYDPTMGELINLWSINNVNYIPTEVEITKALEGVDCSLVTTNGNKVTTNSLLDLGSLVKGYASDEIENYLREKAVDSALINLGGNIQLINSKPNDETFKIGVTKPEIDNTTNSNVLILDIEDVSLITSGINQRFFEEDGVIYHHIIDPTTGYPSNNNLASVTIVNNSGVLGDLLSTTTFLLGLDRGIGLINSIDNTEAIFITKDKEIYFTTDEITYELLDDTYTIK